jgi:predicted HTH transcriptional regulator
LQVIPENEELWKLDNFELFLQERRRMLAEELNDFLEKLTKTEESNIEVSIDQIITEGESEELEFKSSIRWNYKAEMVDKKMENVIMKSICAFGNGQGGKLIIGVDDEGEILGLDYDFNSLGGDKDKFELHLRNLINDNFGKVFATNNIKINFETINDNDICVMEIKKSIKPLYVEISENNQKAKRFYVRSGNTSQELSIEDINEYISSRF